jgi:hypothetical protein
MQNYRESGEMTNFRGYGWGGRFDYIGGISRELFEDDRIVLYHFCSGGSITLCICKNLHNCAPKK